MKKNHMDYPSYEVYQNKYDKFLEDENKKKNSNFTKNDYTDLKVEEIRKLFFTLQLKASRT